MKVSIDKTRLGWVFLAVLLSSLLVYRPADVGIRMQALFEWMHVPVFAAITATVWALLPATTSFRRKLVLTMVASTALAFLTEIAQIPLGRDAQKSDVVADLTASLIVLLLVVAAHVAGWRRVLPVVISIALLAWSLIPLVAINKAFMERQSQFPQIFAGNAHDQPFVTARGSALDGGIRDIDRRAYTRVTLLDVAWPGIEIHDLQGDWQPFDVLTIELEIEGDEPLEIIVRVHDTQHQKSRDGYNDRFNRNYTLAPGRHSIRISTEEIRNSPRGRQMDMNSVASIYIFTTQRFAGRQFRLYEINLN